MTLNSMTGFADLAGGAEGLAWVWEARSVNGRGLDLRLRLPEGFDGLDGPLRAAFAARFARGSISVGLRIAKGERGSALRLNPEALAAAIEAALAAETAASARGLALAPPSAVDLLALRGVMEGEGRPPQESPAVMAALAADAPKLASALWAARAAEGAALAGTLAGHADRIAELAVAARAAAEARKPRQAEALRQRVATLLAAGAPMEETRLAQELALIAVKADVAEELDRLAAHLEAARKLLGAEGPAGRKLDFLTQEFNREVNTLCSKAQSAELTSIGLEMKVAVDQLREQVQNVE